MMIERRGKVRSMYRVCRAAHRLHTVPAVSGYVRPHQAYMQSVPHPNPAAADIRLPSASETARAVNHFLGGSSMKFISWNIDSLNAGLTGQSPRAELTRAVLSGIASENADFIAIQETKLPEAGMNKKQLTALKDLFPVV